VKQADRSRSPIAAAAIVEDENFPPFRPTLNDVTERLAEIYIANTSPDVVERLLNIWMEYQRRRQEQYSETMPTFAPMMSPKTQKLFETKLHDNKLTHPTISTLSYMAAQEELREKLDKKQALDDRLSPPRSKSPRIKTRDQHQGLRGKRESSNQITTIRFLSCSGEFITFCKTVRT